MRSDDHRHKGPAASGRRIRLIALHTLGEAVRMRLTVLLGLIGAALVLATRWLRDFNFGTAELNFIGDFGLGALGFLGTLLAALVTAQLFFSDLAGGAACCVLTRPVRRWEYLAGQLAGVAALLALFTAALGLLVAGLLVWRSAQLGAAPPALPVFLCACAVQWFKLTLVATMTLLVCSYAGTALFASCAGLLLALAAHLRPLTSAGGRLAWFRVWPNLALFDAESMFASGQVSSGTVLLGLAVYWAAYVILFSAVAAYVFNRREF
jgi:ABC-type transport system involved in multi-copper enzyme maturation permease subunit